MTDRPTPEQIAAKHLSLHRRGSPSMSGPLPQDQRRAKTLISHLRHEGYVIVHPDDVPERSVIKGQILSRAVFNRGWNACRRHIFGGDR